MGQGVGFVCSRCKKEYGIGAGIGRNFPQVYKETLEGVKSGEYGEEFKKLAGAEGNVAVDAEIYLYLCNKCGAWKTEKGLALYVPKDPSQEAEDCVMGRRLQEGYRLLRRYIHLCDKCGGVMHKASYEEERNLHCPYCGGAPEQGTMKRILWD